MEVAGAPRIVVRRGSAGVEIGSSADWDGFVPQDRFSSSDWCIRLTGARTARGRVICFPSAGGSATAFKPWIAQVPAGIELLALQFPGRQKRLREAPMRDLRVAVKALLPAIAPLSGPNTVFVGDCTGALVAYETIRGIVANGFHPPKHFLVSCCRAPDLRPRHDPLHSLDESALIAQMRLLSFAPEWLLKDMATLRWFLPVLRSDLELAESYVDHVGDPLVVPITAVAGTEDRITPEPDVAAWRRYTVSRFDFVPMNGGHDLAVTRVAQLVALVSAALGTGGPN
jgi:surfactin synthase thioesterase subunit